MNLLHELNITDQLVYSNPSLPRYVVQRGDKAGYKMVSVPLSITNFIFTPLLSLVEKLRVITGAMGFIAKPKGEETIKGFISRHFGAGLYNKLMDPFISGVYAGNGGRLSMSAAFPKVSAVAVI